MLDRPPAPGRAFEGLLPSPADTPARTGQRRYIFQIHGMDTTDPSYADTLLGLIANEGYSQTTLSAGPDGTPWIPARLATTQVVTGEALTCAGPGAPACVFPTFGEYRVDRFENARTGDVVTVYSYYWRGDLWKIEGAYINHDLTPATPIAEARSPINNLLKYSVMDNGLVDAAAYLGPMGSLVREGIETTLCAMVADAVGTDAAKRVAPGSGCLTRMSETAGVAYPQDVEFDFLSYSLGSRMLFDVLNPPGGLEAAGPAAGTLGGPGDGAAAVAPGLADPLASRRFLAGRMRSFFMAANQLPLLAIGRVSITEQPLGAAPYAAPAPGAPAARPRTFLDLRPGSLESRVEGSATSSAPLEIIGFQDPDDLLGFRAGDAIDASGSPQVTVRDIMHRNTPQWLWLFSWAPAAHATELERPTSTKLILCGGRTDVAGHLHPYVCNARGRGSHGSG